MDFNISEDDIHIDYMCLIDKPLSNTVTTMREVCQDKRSYQEPPLPPITPSSSMLNDEAPDNLLSSAALEKNIFSDDDEYGLYRLKRSEKNVAKSNWEMDFTTDDLIRKESDLGLDIDNLPPTSLPPSQIKNDTEKIFQSNEVKDDPSQNIVPKSDIDSEKEEERELIFEVVTEGNVGLKEDENGDLCDIECVPVSFHYHSQSSCNDEANESNDDNISLALDDHNYTSPKLKFDVVAQYINTMTPDQESIILGLLESKKRNNGRCLVKRETDNGGDSEREDDAVSNASTQQFLGGDRESDTEVSGGEENDGDETCVRQQTGSLKTLCKEELIIDERSDADSGSNLSEDENGTDERPNQEDKQKDVEVWMRTEKSIGSEVAEIVESSPISPLSDFNGFAEPVHRCLVSNTLCAGGKTTSTESTCFSENRSEPNEFFDTEDFSSSGSENEEAGPDKSDDDHISLEVPIDASSKTTIKVEDLKEAEIAMEVETTSNEKVENETTKQISLEADQQTTESKDQNREISPALASNRTIAQDPENPKLLELKIFANRLLGLCERWKSDSNLDEEMNVLLADFREIIGKPKVVSSETQTEKIYSKERQKKMNEKAKNKLLNASSSSSEDMSNSDTDDNDNDEIETNQSIQEPPSKLSDDCEEEIAGDDEKFEKSPSYSDLSSRASSEEFLNSENDDPVSDDGIDLSKYAVPSPIKSTSQETEDLDLSKYEVRSEVPIESQKAPVTSEQMSIDEDQVTESVAQKETAEEDTEKTTGDKSPFDDSSANPMIDIGCDEDANYDNNEVVENEVIENDGDAVEIECEVEIQVDDMEEEKESVEEIIARDEKLKSEAMVVVNKLSEKDLEVYYDDLNEKEIRKLLSFSGLVKKKTSEAPQNTSERPQIPMRSKKTEKLMEILKDAENDICSDESNSDEEEAAMTERDFLKLCNQKAKDDFLKSSSSDSEVDTKMSEEEIMDEINMSDYSSSDDETRPAMVDKFLENFSSKLLHDEKEKVQTETENLNDECVVDEAGKQNEAIEVLVDKETDNHMDKNPGSALSEAMDMNEFGEEIGGGELSDDVVEINDASKNDKEAESNNEKEDPTSAPKPSLISSNGILRSVRNILVEKEIDIDAIEKETASLSNDETDICDRHLSRKLNNSKSLETLIEESQRRQNAKSTDNNIVSLDSDSDCEEISIEPDVRKRSIKPMLRKDQLAGETRSAQRRENERIKRLERKNEMLTKLIQEHKDSLELMVDEKELILDYHSENKTFVKVHPQIVKHLKEHQFEGIKFMYDNTYGSVDNLPKHPGSGCILAHCMGLGKTLQIVALLHTVINYKELDTRKILVLCPKSTIMNWDDEIRRWLGPLKSNNLKIFSFKDTSSSIEDKIKILHEWSSSGKPGFRTAGVLLMGYEAFRMLVFNPLHKKKIVTQLQTERIKKKIRETLLEPGADLVICDEGHIIKNRKSATSSAVSEISTPRRIILTGTPIQNNLKEYYAMVNFIKPKFLGTEKEFANLYENPIRNGQHKDSNKRDIKIMKQRSFVLHKKLSKFVQRREAALLKTFLPMKYEYVLFIPMTDVQIKLYEYFLEVSSKREGSKGKNLIPDYTCLRKIWTHPRVLENAWKNAMLKKQNTTKKSPVREPNSDDEVPDDVYDTQTGALSVTDDWWRSLIAEDNLKSILPSSKLQVMFDILRMCEEKREKCLIFSAFVAVLDCVEFFMHQITIQGENAREYGLTMFRGPWVSGKDYYRLDGKTPKNIRHEMIKRFNDPTMTQARVFLISAKAGGQGINLIGANRVIILDTSWNPSNDQQNIFRVFRLGQKRQCYVYRLIAMGTMEEKVYSRSVTKQAMSFRVVDEQQIDRHYSMAELTELYTLTKPDYQNRPVPTLPQDSILANLLRCSPHLVYKYHEHDSLLENKLEQELSEQEKADAWDAYERDLQGNQNPNVMPGMSNVPPLFNPPFFGPGMGYGFPPDRNFPLGYGGLSAGYLSSLANYTGNSSLMEMLKMYSAPPPGGPSLMPGINPGPSSSPQGNLMHPFGPGVLPSSPGTSSSHPLNLPPFNSLQSMVSSTGINSIPSFTSPYSSMANSYNLSTDPALLHLSQMYAPSLGPSSMPPSSPTGRQQNGSPSAGGVANKRNSPFPSGLMAPMTTAESIPTSVIKPPQAHSASTPRQSTSTPTLAQQLSNHSMPGPPFPKPPLNNTTPSSLQQQLAKPRAPTLDYRSQVIQSIYQNSMSRSRSGDPPHSQSIAASAKSSTTYSSNTTVACTLPSAVSTLSTTTSNRSSPITTASRNSPQLKSSSSSNGPRATNIGIVYPYESSPATITPISSAPSAATSMSSISVRSVSSINNASTSKLTIPATIISKPGTNVSTALPTIYKPSSSNNMNNAIGGNSSLTVSPAGKQYNGPSISKASTLIEKSQTPPTTPASSVHPQFRYQGPPQISQDKQTNSVDKSTIQILGTNNVQLTKVPNSRSTFSKAQNNSAKIQTYSRNRTGSSQASSATTASVITKARANSGLTVVPVPNNNSSITSNGKLMQNESANAVPTLVPLSTKTNINPSASSMFGVKNKNAKLPSSMSATSVMPNVPAHIKQIRPGGTKSPVPVVKKTTNNPTSRMSGPAPKLSRIQSTTPSPTTVGASVKRSISLVNLPVNKQARPPLSNSTQPRQTSLLLSNTQNSLTRPQMSLPGKLATSASASNLASASSSSASVNKSALSIRSIDAINKFANAGITISPGRTKGVPNNSQHSLGNVVNQTNNNMKNVNSLASGNQNTLSNSVTLSKVIPTSRKRPIANLTSKNMPSVNQVKKLRVGPTVEERNVAESLLRARSNQGLTVLLKNSQAQQKSNKDGKVADVVEID